MFGIFHCLLVPQDSYNNEQEGTSAGFDAIRSGGLAGKQSGVFLLEKVSYLCIIITPRYSYEASGGYYRRVYTCTSCLTPTMTKGRNTISCAECLNTQ